MGAVLRREVDAVVCVKKLDRVARSVRYLTEVAAELEARGVALVVTSQGESKIPAGDRSRAQGRPRRGPFARRIPRGGSRLCADERVV